ncbi:MAG: hypothetical protein KDB61_09670 [Planctomycetes bacterium]|nr:hypothetical protein [Planctomycetota bacterium]
MLRATSLSLLLLAAACASEPKRNDEAALPANTSAHNSSVEAMAPTPPPKPAPWTEDFGQGAILIADTIRIEGPPGLMVHAALTVDDSLCILEQKTTEQGFLQVVTPRPLAQVKNHPNAGRELRCQLDRWTLAAVHRIEVLERPGPCDVVITATGNATWRDLNNKVEEGERIEFRGTAPKE